MSTNTVAAPENNQVAKKPFDVIEETLGRIENMQTQGKLVLPANYHVENALRSAWLIIQQVQDLNSKPALEVCTGISIANALFDMVLQGLNPVKKQCYFIVYGNKLTLQKSYFGTIAISKRVAGVTDAVGVPIYEKDAFKYTIDIKSGVKTVTQHDQDFENIDNTKLKGAYAVITYNDGRVEYDIMTMQQIRASWEMGKAKGNSPAHNKFPDQMAAKTVVGRALKIPINSSNDDDLFEIEGEVNPRNKQVEEDIKLEIMQHGNKDEIGFDEVQNPEVIENGHLNDHQKELIANAQTITKQAVELEAKISNPIQPLNQNQADNRFYKQTEAAYQEETAAKQTTQIKAPF